MLSYDRVIWKNILVKETVTDIYVFIIEKEINEFYRASKSTRPPVRIHNVILNNFILLGNNSNF